MSGKTFSEAPGAMSKAEKVAWLQFGLLLIASACLGWLWWSSWPDNEALQRNAAVFERWPSWFMLAALAGHRADQAARPERAVGRRARPGNQWAGAGQFVRCAGTHGRVAMCGGADGGMAAGPLDARMADAGADVDAGAVPVA